MAKARAAISGLVRVAAACMLGGLVAACGSDQIEPAPLIMRGAGAEPISEPGPFPISRAPTGGSHVVVRPGQSLRGIAHAHHVPPSAIIAANHLQPPYKLVIGQRLVLPPGAAPMPVQQAALSPPPAADAPRPPAGHRPPEIIPLDGPPAHATATPTTRPAAPTISMPPPASSPAPREPGEATHAAPSPATANAGTSAATSPHGGRFPWPVRGRVLAGYGTAASGTRNDGINIGAPKGAPVSAVDGGVVAYAGNELRGYGNLVLIKHPNGFITAYAHCEELLVKKGEKVSAGQVIAKVGATGGVTEPQLHFELRRGKTAVDPREFLAPAPSADTGSVGRG